YGNIDGTSQSKAEGEHKPCSGAHLTKSMVRWGEELTKCDTTERTSQSEAHHKIPSRFGTRPARMGCDFDYGNKSPPDF
ncbi:hypothetical protein HAX54_017445, partial [Datura stramonium]|nr:hypothetical protein [Datura stramonium]